MKIIPMGPPGMGYGILVDGDGEAWDLKTGRKARQLPDGVYGGATFTNCWFIEEPPAVEESA